MASIRTWHTYIGILIAPSVIFFALTGALQIFGLHEAHAGYQPPLLLEKLSTVHKDQVFEKKTHEHAAAPAEAAGSSPATDEEEPPPAARTLVLKWFFLIVAIALMLSTVLGLWMGLTHVRHKRIGAWLLAIGVILPAGLAFI